MEYSLLDQEKSFSSFSLDDRLLKAIDKMGFKKPTIIQSHTLPLALQGKDILARAKTGSGKTAAYSIPILQNILIQEQHKNFKKVIFFN